MRRTLTDQMELGGPLEHSTGRPDCSRVLNAAGLQEVVTTTTNDADRLVELEGQRDIPVVLVHDGLAVNWSAMEQSTRRPPGT